jgi:hypothetical protein
MLCAKAHLIEEVKASAPGDSAEFQLDDDIVGMLLPPSCG